jgi:hypothetical protein
MYNKTARDRVVRRTAESAAGLIQLAQQRKTVALDIEHAAKRHAICAGAIERYVPPLSCYRSVSKRSLSTPTTFLSTHQRLDWGGSFLTFTSALFELLHGDDGAGVPFGALALAQLPPQPDTLRFLDTNSPDRARIENMVLIGMRAKVAVDLTFEETGLSSFNEEYNAGAAADTIENYVRDYVALAAYYSADSLVATDTVTPDAAAPASPNVYRRPAEPWFDFTPLRYFRAPIPSTILSECQWPRASRPRRETFSSTPTLSSPSSSRRSLCRVPRSAATTGQVSSAQCTRWAITRSTTRVSPSFRASRPTT